MTSFLYPRGVVYILENVAVQRVKVGMSGIGVNSVAERLRDVNDMWSGRKVSCQICAGRLLNVSGLVPIHVVSGRKCSGGGELPLEKSVALAEARVAKLEDDLEILSGSEMGSVRRMIRSLARRIEKYRDYSWPAGSWEIRVTFHTEGVAEVEAATHEILAECLDESAPFGEVFRCSVQEAAEAVETAMMHYGVLHSSVKSAQS